MLHVFTAYNINSITNKCFFFQGYKCEQCFISVHKSCIPESGRCGLVSQRQRVRFFFYIFTYNYRVFNKKKFSLFLNLYQ